MLEAKDFTGLFNRVAIFLQCYYFQDDHHTPVHFQEGHFYVFLKFSLDKCIIASKTKIVRGIAAHLLSFQVQLNSQV